MFAGAVAKVFEDLAAFEKGLAFGKEAFEFDGAHLAAILLGLRAALAVFVIVEETLNASGLAVKEIDEMPGEIVKVIFEAGVGDGR